MLSVHNVHIHHTHIPQPLNLQRISSPPPSHTEYSLQSPYRRYYPPQEIYLPLNLWEYLLYPFTWSRSTPYSLWYSLWCNHTIPPLSYTGTLSAPKNISAIHLHDPGLLSPSIISHAVQSHIFTTIILYRKSTYSLSRSRIPLSRKSIYHNIILYRKSITLTVSSPKEIYLPPQPNKNIISYTVFFYTTV